MTVTPYKFQLKKVSSNERRLVEALLEFLPATGLRDGFERAVGEAFARHVGEGVSYQLTALSRESASECVSKIPKGAVLVVLGLAPLDKKAVLDVDPMLAKMIVDRVLGGGMEPDLEMRKLSDTEQGVLQYILLQLLKNVHKLCGKDARVHFRFEKFADSGADVNDLFDAGGKVAILSFRVEMGRRSGFVRLILPDPFIAQAFLKAETSGEMKKLERRGRQADIAAFGFIECPIWAEVGHTMLTAADLDKIEEGDVVIFDHSLAFLEDDRPKGRALLRVGAGTCGGFESELSVAGRRAHLKIERVIKGE